MVSKALAFVQRDFRTQSSYRLNFIFQMTGMLVSISIFYFISQILGTAVSPYLERYNTDYFHFALMGLAFYPLIGISTNSLSEVINEYQQTGTLEVLFLSPSAISSLLIMSTLWNYCWAFGEMFFFLAAGSLIFQANLNWPNIFAAIFIIILTIFANAGLALINAGFVLVTKRPSPLARLLRHLTNLLAGLYYPIEILPDWLRFFSYLMPATYTFEALRLTMLQQTSFLEIGPQILALVIFTIILLPLGLFAFRYAIYWAKVDGSLSQY